MNHSSQEQQVTYVDLESLKYPRNVVLFLRKKLDDFAIDCFRNVINQRKNGGLNKTKIENFNDHRKRYDAAFLTLEVQGFIETRPIGNSKPYFITIRGQQLVNVLQEEVNKNNSEGREMDV